VENIESKYRKFFRFEINRCKLKHIICVRCDVTVRTPKIPAASGKSRQRGHFGFGSGQFILIEGDGYRVVANSSQCAGNPDRFEKICGNPIQSSGSTILNSGTTIQRSGKSLQGQSVREDRAEGGATSPEAAAQR
jgi:hypothetical protein